MDWDYHSRRCEPYPFVQKERPSEGRALRLTGPLSPRCAR
jgi:hypothetical protein